MPASLPILNQLILMAGWAVFVALFFGRRRRPRERGVTATRSSGGLLGMGVQGLGFACCWLRRPNVGSLGSAPSPRDYLLTALIVGLMTWSISFAVAAMRTLGKQWALDARVLDTHALVTEGPYDRVRHPIYTAMGGMLVATGLTMSPWWALVAGLAVYGLGTLVRMRAEERLLLNAFGDAYEAYRARVPAVVPRRL
jgi:protein-S-isoprenylcysteine O-methyltransferase Ste14